ncbi:MAG: G5 domain-containing protein [Bacilli bacterium]
MKKRNKRRNSYSLAMTKKSNKNKHIKIVVIVFSITFMLATIGMFYKFTTKSEIEVKYKIYGEVETTKVSRKFSIDDLDLESHNDKYKISNEDIVKINKKEYKYKNAKNIKLKARDKIEIIDVYYEEIIKKIPIKYENETKEENTIKKGHRILVQQGEDGEEIITYKVEFRNGKQYDKYKTKNEIDKEPLKEIILIGIGETTTYSGNIDPGLNFKGNKNIEEKNIPKQGTIGEQYEDVPGYIEESGEGENINSSECTITINGIVYPC